MNHALAAAITAEYAPKLIVDPPISDRMLVVRAKEKGTPFSITLSDSLLEAFQDIPGREAQPEQAAVEPTDDHPGSPYIPAQPAVGARTVEGQRAEAERRMLIQSLDTAKQVLGVE